MLAGVGVETNADFDAVAEVAADVASRLDLGATSHVLMGGTVEAVLRRTTERDTDTEP